MLLGTEMLWPILLLLLGIFLVFLEVLIPSGGILTVLAGAALIGSIVLAFAHGGTWSGIGMITAVGIGVPLTVGFAFKILPRTPFGRLLILPQPEPDHFDARTEKDRERELLVGKVGRTLTQLRPAGVVEIDGKRVDTVAEGVVIDPGKLVRVIAVEGRRVIVREIDENKLVDSQGSETEEQA